MRCPDPWEPMDLAALTAMETPDTSAARPDAVGPARLEDLLPDHLQLGDLIGQGGFGRVYRARDLRLDRDVALKVLSSERMRDPAHVARLVAEARITARLDHPAIVPVYELARLASGDVCYTMKIVDGQHLGAVRTTLVEPGDAAGGGRRMLAYMVQAAAAVAHAHQHGVAHGDLKPSNILVGARDEVWVVDWGLARALDSADPPRGGTPGYRPPEGDRGPALSGDVYGLGATLFALLTGRRPPDCGPENPDAAVHAERLTAALAPIRDEGEDFAALVDIVQRALSWHPDDRHADAGVLHIQLRDWLDGAHRHTSARTLVDEARGYLDAAVRSRHLSALRRSKAHEASRALPTWTPVGDKAHVRALAHQAAEAARQAALQEAQAEQLLHRALEWHAGSADARRLLAALYQERLAVAEAQGRVQAAAVAEAGLRRHDRGEWAAWLEGAGRLSLQTRPAGAEAVLHALIDRDGVLEEGPAVSLGRTPLVACRLARGRYVLRLRHPDRPEVVVPLDIHRCEHWDHVAPGASTPTSLVLPTEDDLKHDAIYVPPGWAWIGMAGGQNKALERARRWVDGFLIQRTSVDNASYAAFLNDLVGRGREDAALRHVPRERGGNEWAQDGIIFARDAEGRFFPVPDADGHPWPPDAPVVMVTWRAAVAYAEWFAARTGQPWRLVWELEWEKAARGVSGRLQPWGDRLEHTWVACYGATQELETTAEPLRYPNDRSVYGVLGMAGCSRDQCLDPWRLSGWFGTEQRQQEPHLRAGSAAPSAEVEPERVTRGGSVFQSPIDALTTRYSGGVDMRRGDVGFRLAMSWPPR